MGPINSSSICFFLYEGKTEIVFYSRIFREVLNDKKFKVIPKNLNGSTGITAKVKSAILGFLDNPNYLDRGLIHILVAYDRDGNRNIDGRLNIDVLRKDFLSHDRIGSIEEVIATEDIESWLFHDVEGLFKYLKVPKPQQNKKKFLNVDATNCALLSELFRKYRGEFYRKGENAKPVIDSLDINKIYENCDDLRSAIELLKSNCEGTCEVTYDLEVNLSNSHYLNEGDFTSLDDFYKVIIGANSTRNIVPDKYNKIFVYINPSLNITDIPIVDWLTDSFLLMDGVEVVINNDAFIKEVYDSCEKDVKRDVEHLESIQELTDIEIAFK
jgi:Domain of unknown function (DUF4276)